MRSLIFLLLVSGLWFGSPAQAQDAGNTPEGNTDRGQFVFNDRGCYQCHGYEAHGGSAGARLAPNPIPFGVFSLYVRRPTGQMPPYTRTVLSDGELADIYAFLVSIPSPPPVESLPALYND